MKVSKALDPEFVLKLADVMDLDEATFWWCPKCKRPVVVAAERDSMKCRSFDHRPLDMVKLDNDMAGK